MTHAVHYTWLILCPWITHSLLCAILMHCSDHRQIQPVPGAQAAIRLGALATDARHHRARCTHAEHRRDVPEPHCGFMCTLVPLLERTRGDHVQLRHRNGGGVPDHPYDVDEGGAPAAHQDDWHAHPHLRRPLAQQCQVRCTAHDAANAGARRQTTLAKVTHDPARDARADADTDLLVIMCFPPQMDAPPLTLHVLLAKDDAEAANAHTAMATRDGCADCLFFLSESATKSTARPLTQQRRRRRARRDPDHLPLARLLRRRQCRHNLRVPGQHFQRRLRMVSILETFTPLMLQMPAATATNPKPATPSALRSALGENDHSRIERDDAPRLAAAQVMAALAHAQTAAADVQVHRRHRRRLALHQLRPQHARRRSQVRHPVHDAPAAGAPRRAHNPRSCPPLRTCATR